MNLSHKPRTADFWPLYMTELNVGWVNQHQFGLSVIFIILIIAAIFILC